MSNQSTINSSRLSVALLDLPLTPFGMKASPASKNIPQSIRHDHIKNKTSKLCLKSLRENQNLPNLEEKENFNFLNNMKNVNVRRHRRNKQQRDTPLEGKPSFAQNVAFQPEITITDSTSDIRTNRRESLFTDIDEGSFVEFTGAALPTSPSFKEKMNLLYYTCSEENETKYSTSSKQPSSPVGFRKFIDKVRNANEFKSITEEVSPSKESGDFKRKFNLDESVITGSKDIMSRIKGKNCMNAMINSTVNNPKSKIVPMFPDISTISLNKVETSYRSNPDVNMCTNKSVEYIELSESEDNQNFNEKQNNKSYSHDVKIQNKNQPVREDPIKYIDPESSLISEDISLASTVIIQKESNNCPTLRFKSPVNASKSNIHNFDNENEDVNNSGDVGDRLVGWILNSPFKDSSFGTSFINKEVSPKMGKVNAGISSQSLDLRLSDDFSPGKSSGRTVFTLGRVPESPEIEDVLCDARKVISDGTISSNDQNTNENLKDSFYNFVPEKNRNYSEANHCQKGFSKVNIKVSDNKPSAFMNTNFSSIFKSAEKSFKLNVSESEENSAFSHQLKKQSRKKSISLDAVNKVSDVSIEEYPSAGELYSSFILGEEIYKPKNGLNISLSKSEGELNTLNTRETYNSLLLEKKNSKHNLESKISLSNSSELNPLNNSEKLHILETFSDTDSHQKEVNGKAKLFNGLHSIKNGKEKNKSTFVLGSSEDSLPDLDTSDHDKSKKVSNLFDDFISSTLKEKLNITETNQTKSNIFSNSVRSNENFKKGEKSFPVNKSFSCSESSDDFENYIQSVKKKTENTHKNTKIVISDSDFIVSDSDVEYISPVTTNQIKQLPECNTYPSIREPKSTKNDWRKPPKFILSSSSESEEDCLPTKDHKQVLRRKNVKRKQRTNKHISAAEVENNKTPRSFLSSLTLDTPSSEAHEDAIPFIKKFNKLKEPLTAKLYNLFNSSIFDNKLPSSMNIRWNSRLRKTAGYCYYQLDKSKPMGRGSRIELSSKVIDAPGRLRDTLIHELCHAASWIISGYKDGHGPIWKSWASKARQVFPELPVISRCHSYEIHCKFTYKCMKCGYSIGRHSKSLDTERKVCGYCHGKFELIVNYQSKTPTSKPANSQTTKGVFSAPQSTPRAPNSFALYVKNNYGTVKKSQTNLKHKDVMKVLSEDFAKIKLLKNSECEY